MKTTIWQRALCMILCAAMLLVYLPSGVLRTKAATTGEYTTVADPETLTRPETIYGDNTVNAGKVTVGKSVSKTDITVNGQSIAIDGDNNFLITISQSAQVMGLATETGVPVDVVFVLDTSGSMEDNSRATTMVTAANSAISTLMSANEQNRVAVVAFSSANYGGGTSGGAAANVLSSLAHYTGNAASAHLRWVNSSGSASGDDRTYIAGRDLVTVSSYGQSRQVNAYRNGLYGGTNIQAGIIEGAKLLTEVNDTQYTDPVTGDTVTRIPFLIILSDGQPTYTYNDETWYDPDSTGQQGPGSDAYEGNGFIAAMTAAYYKSLITEHYYGEKAGGENHCYVYTLGVELDSLTGDEKTLAQITLDPKTYTAGDYAAATANSYWNYGNTANDNNRNAYYGWKSYWNNYLAGADFDVRVNGSSSQGTYVWSGNGEPEAYYEVARPREPNGWASQAQWNQYYANLAVYNDWLEWREDNFTFVSGEMYTFTAESIAASKQYVSSIAYNDEYFSADSVSQMEAIFQQMVTTIQQKAISAPTKVTTGDYNFDGYVTFTDPLGDYMEVKDMKGILADGYFYQGASFAQKLSKFGSAEADAEFDELLVKVLQSRMKLTDSVVDLNAFAAKVLASENQAYYNSASDYDNSIVWWGNAYDSGEEDQQVQVVGFADNDTIEYIEAQQAAGNVPENADYVCRSYFFYGEAGGANPNPDHEYLYFMVRVQRELEAPYRQTVVISAPASLLSMEKVLITETTDENGNLTYTSTVEHQEPARVVYEVGLWDTITPENVSYVVSPEYANEQLNGTGSVNYDPTTGTYNFFTNDWDRSQTVDSHHRAMAKATFDAAVDNPFYTYQQDTLVVDADGNAVTADPAGTTAYYVREYYEWAADNGADGTYTATKGTKLISVEIPADARLVRKDGKWYLPKGAYTAATLVTNGDDTVKSSNDTGTSSIVAHPHRTGDSSNSHYTVYLGNNGMLSLVSDPYEPEKTVSVNLPDGALTIVDDEGEPVQVGDVLTYTVEVKNVLNTKADITVKDYVPLGTAFVAGSAGFGKNPTGHTKDASITPDSNNVLTWTLEDVPAGETRYVSFQTTVTEAAMSLTVVPGTLDNTAQVKIGNNTTVRTNTTHNPPYGKTVTDVNGTDIDGRGGYKVGDTLVYHIRFHNDATDNGGNYVAADVTVTDKIPEGTTFLSADNGGTYDATTGVVTWKFDNMTANTGKVVTLQVQINASVEVDDGEIYLPNTATITVDNNPIVTNTTENWADVGDMVITKTVAAGGDRSKTFTIDLTESTGLLNGTYVLLRGTASETVTFSEGKASVSIKHGETLTIKELPAGVIISVAEDAPAGWTPAYNTQSVTITQGAATTVSSVSVTNTYTLQPLTVTVKGVKNMSGAVLNGSITFGFVAQPDSNNPEVGQPLTGEVVVSGNGAFTFSLSPKVFTAPGLYKYTITEIDGGVLGVQYDTTAHALQINVIDNGDGTMRAEATLNGAAFDLANGAVSFTNNYDPADAQLIITADKVLTGRTLTAGEFTFRLTDGINTYYGINDANGNIVFETIAYSAVDTYTYSLSEVIPNPKAEGVTYDTNSYTVKVEIKDEDGQLVPTVTVDGTAKTVTNHTVDTGITFQNSFVPDDVPLNLVALKVLKAYDPAADSYVDAAPEAGKFRFQIKDADGNSVAIGTNDANGNIAFETIYFSADMLSGVAADQSGNRSKTFTYTISEVVPELAKDPNMKYDLAGKEVAVKLTYAANGTLTVTVGTDSDGSVDLTGSHNFINYSNPASVSVTPTGRKTTTGQNLPEGLSFSFKVVPVDGTTDAATGSSDATRGGTDSETTGITFTSMVYTHESLGGEASKTYSYWIMESNASVGTVTGSNGVTYDSTRYLYQVTLSRDAYNRLVATEKYFGLAAGGNAENAADYTVDLTTAGISFNNKYQAETHINLTAAKQLTGRTPGLAANEFDFVLKRLDSTGKPINTSQITGTNTAAGLVQFATLNYSSAMLDDAYKHTDGCYYFSYLMSEIKPEGVAVPGVTYDAAKYIVTIKLTQTASGLTAELAGVSEAVYTQATDSYASGTAVSGFTAAGSTNVTFTNTYKTVEGDVIRYQIRKDLEGRHVRAGEFEFGLYLNGELVDVATNDANGIVTFSRTIPATAAVGTYEMVIKEFKGSAAGVTYSDQEYTIYVKVTDNSAGKIEATVHLTEDGPALAEDANGMVDLTNSFVFTNTYEARDTTYTPAARKELTGRTQVTGEFSFQAQLIDDGAPVANGAVYKGINDANGNILFETIYYTETGTFLYKLSEVQGSAVGMKYDTQTYYLKVVVSDDGNGYLKAAASYYTDAECTSAASNVVFKNAYTPSAIPVELVGSKTLNGRKLVDKEFSFLVYKEGQTTPVASGSNDEKGNIKFSTFHITAEDMKDDNGAYAASRTFTYQIVESDNKLPGVTYAAPVTVKVTVTNTNGVLAAAVSYPEGQSAKFVNTYTPAPVELPLVAYKTLTGKDMQAFTFELKDAAGKVVQRVSNNESGVVAFENLKFEKAGTYVYTLTEKAGTMAGMDYDETVYTITVEVKDDLNGSLIATAAYKKGNEAAQVLQFANRYTPPALEVELVATKTIVDTDGNKLTGTKYPLSGFEFEVFDAEGKLVTDAVSDASGKIKFTDLTFTAAGEYRFLISEKATTKPGYTTDPTIWCVHITIGYNADIGVLYKANEYIHVAPETHNEERAVASQDLSFVNVYDPADVTLTLKGKKILDGRELKEHEFTFYMVDKATGLRAAESRNHANGEINFRLHYAKAGTYAYTVYEEIPAEPNKLGGVIYTTKTHEVTVEVTDDGTGALEAKVGGITVLNAGTADLTGTVVFTNTYTPAAAEATVEARKHLTGRNLGDKEFTFELVNTLDATETYTATNHADGKVVFQKLTFDADDMVDANGERVTEKVFTYSLSEVKGALPGVTYDDDVYTVVITVTDNGHGQLNAAVKYLNYEDDVEAVPVFQNFYEAKPVTYSPEGKKIFEGDDMRTFTFVLSGDGFQTQVKTNDEKGNVIFDALTFTKADTYTFTVSEQADAGMEDVKWDTNVYTLTIEVRDPGMGQLVVHKVSVTSENGRDDLVFRNVHEDLITKKDVFMATKPTVSIDGKTVKKGDVLTYVVSYTNYTGKAVDVTITDTVPQYTTYKDESADNGGIYANGVLTWKFTDVAPNATVTVSFDVTVTGDDVKLENQATVLEGNNVYQSNTVTNPVEKELPPVTPDTGDDTDLGGLVGTMAFSALGIVMMLAVLLLGRKKETFEQ